MLYVVMVTAAHVQSMEDISCRHHRRRQQLFMNYKQQTLRQSWPAASFNRPTCSLGSTRGESPRESGADPARVNAAPG